MHARLIILALLITCCCLHAQDEGSKTYPEGKSDHTFQSLHFTLDVPKGLGQAKKGSLVILLHGMGGKGKTIMTVLDDWRAQGFIVCAPQATGRGWNAPDLDVVEKLGAHLLKALPVDHDRVHVMGFSNGGFNLPRLAGSEILKPRSAVYVGSGFSGGTPPKWAKKHQGVLAVAGEQDPYADSTRATPRLLAGKVRAVETRFQPRLGHRWPRKLNPYILWWMCVQEGRFRYGESLVFEWQSDLPAALSELESQKKGGVLLYLYNSKSKEEEKAARAIEHELFFDPVIRYYAGQIQAVEIDVAMKESPFPALKKTPCIAVLTRKGKIKKALSGTIKAKALRRALSGVVPTKKIPDDIKPSR